MNDEQRLIILIATLRHMAKTKPKTPEAGAVVKWAKDLLDLIEVPIEAPK